MRKWVKTENLLAEPDGGESRPKFGVYRYDEDTTYYGETDGKTKGIMGKAFAWNYKYQGGSYMVLNKTQIVKDYGRFSLDKEGNYRRPSFYDSSEDFKI